jgi:hypothetical protein
MVEYCTSLYCTDKPLLDEMPAELSPIQVYFSKQYRLLETVFEHCEN